MADFPGFSVLVTFPAMVIKHLEKATSKKGRVYFGMQYEGTVMAGKEWCQDYEVAAHTVYSVRKQREMKAGTQSWDPSHGMVLATSRHGSFHLN